MSRKLKTCTKCGTDQERSFFRVLRNKSLCSWCRDCEREYAYKRRIKKEKQERVRQISKKHRQTDTYKITYKAYRKKYTSEHKDQIQKYNKEYYQKRDGRQRVALYRLANQDKVREGKKRDIDKLANHYLRGLLRGRGYTNEVIDVNPNLIDWMRQVIKDKRQGLATSQISKILRMKTKLCPKCKIKKSVDEFGRYNRKGRKPTFKSWCKRCECDYARQRWKSDLDYREANKQRRQKESYQNWLKEYRKRPDLKERYKDTKQKCDKVWRQNNIDRKGNMDKLWRSNNRDRVAANYREWVSKNRDKIKFLAKMRFKMSKDSLSDGYLIGQLRNKGFSKEMIKMNPELVKFLREILKIKRYVKTKKIAGLKHPRVAI